MQHHSPSQRDTFVGREQELAIIRHHLLELAGGHGGVVLVSGDSGIGKTRLAEVTATLARALGAEVLWGRAHETEGAPAFWPWIQAIRAYVRERDTETLRAELGAGTPVIAQLIPEIEERLGTMSPPPTLEPSQARFHLFDSVSAFLRAAASSRPLLVVLDDLHWVDPPSAFLLQFVAHDLRGAPLLILATYRDTELRHGHPLTQVLADLARDPVSERIELRGLGQADVVRLIEATVGQSPTAALAAMLIRRTEGNPFFVGELVRLLAHEGRLDAWSADREAPTHSEMPQTVQETVARRFDRLSSECCEALSAAAVIGRDFSAGVLERVSASLGTDSLADILHEAEMARIVGEVPGVIGRYRFAHELIREKLYQDLPRSRRGLLHRVIGEALERQYGADITPHLTELANHFARAAIGGDTVKAVAYSRRAAQQSMTVAAYEDAARHYARALQLLELRGDGGTDALTIDTERCEILLSLGDAQRAAGEVGVARETFRRAAALARHITSTELFARATFGFSGETAENGRVDVDAIEMLRESLVDMPEADSGPRAMLLGRLAIELFSAGLQGESLVLGEEALAMARRIGEPSIIAYALSFEARAMNIEQRLTIADEIFRLANISAYPGRALIVGHSWRISGALELADIAAVEHAIERCEALAEELRQPALHAVSTLYRSMLALHTGHLAVGEEFAHRMLSLGQRVGLTNVLQAFGTQLFVLRSLQGRLAELEGTVRGFVAQYPALPAWQCALAYLYTEIGRPAEALAEMKPIFARGLDALPRDFAWFASLVSLAESCAALGDAAHAAPVYDLLLPFADRNVVIGAGYASLGSMSRLLGALAATLGLREAATDHFEAALAMNERIGARPWLARTQIAYAAMLLDGGPPTGAQRARLLLSEASTTAHELGLTRVTEQCDALIEKAERATADVVGMKARSPAGERRQAYPDGLTDREIDVLRLLAQGYTNQEIADSLILSVRTVENHVARIYGKVGARGRAEATGYVFRQGLL